MGNLGRRIGLSQDKGDSNPGAAGGAVGGGILDLFSNGYFERQGDIYNAPGVTPITPLGMTATGGVISDYTDPGPGAVYRAHIFASSGTLLVTDHSSSLPNNVDFLVIGGGGGTGGMNGGYHGGGGGGAGLLHYKTGVSVPVATHPVTIGAGGVGGLTDGSAGNQGGTTTFALSGSPTAASGGGGGGAYSGGPANGGNGGSGGGARYNSAGGTSPGDTGHPGGLDVVSPSNGWGNDGGSPPSSGSGAGGAGGGGAAALGADGVGGGAGGAGGIGGRYSIGGILNTSLGTDGSNPGRYFAGGGSGSHTNGAGAGTAAVAGGGGAAPGGSPTPNNAEASRGRNGQPGTGGGAGAPNAASPSVQGGQGGSGIVVVRYQIGRVASNKATGGAISFYGGKTIHTFTNSGSFNTPGTFNETVEYVAVGGGGGGGTQHAGGGGAGGLTTASIPLNAGGTPINAAIVIGAGAQGLVTQVSTSGTPGAPHSGNNTTVAFPSPVTAGAGGGGGSLWASGPPYGEGASMPLGSGGGGGMNQPPAGGSPDNGGIGGPQGNRGGRGWYHEGYAAIGGGGGGAGSQGIGWPSPYPTAGVGGDGVQIPTTFRNPLSAPSATSPTFTPERGGGLGTPGPAGGYYVAGGGGGAPHPNWPYTGNYGASGGAGGGGHGGGPPGTDPDDGKGYPGVQNTGSGGGGGWGWPAPQGGGGNGGSGIVLIAYPS